MNLEELLKFAVDKNVSDIHITVGLPPLGRINGSLFPLNDDRCTPADTEDIVNNILDEAQKNVIKEKGEIDFSYSIKGLGRFRVNIYRQRGSYSLALRVVFQSIPSLDELGLPPVVKHLAEKTRGLILVTGPAGSGKSTTLAAMIDLINETRNCHILTLEEPIEYLHRHKRSIVNQREIGHDVQNFVAGLRSSLRQDPDVILVGEMRDVETIAAAITAAETGHFVLSAMNSLGADRTIDRMVEIFPPHQQQQIRIQLSTVLQGVVYQQLIPGANGGGRVAAVEVMLATPAIRNLIREGKISQIATSMQIGRRSGMQSMDFALAQLVKEGRISRENALLYCSNEQELGRFLEG